MSKPKRHTWTDAGGMVHARAGFDLRSEARATTKTLRHLTGRIYAPYRCTACGRWHIRLLSREAVDRHVELARSA